MNAEYEKLVKELKSAIHELKRSRFWKDDMENLHYQLKLSSQIEALELEINSMKDEDVILPLIEPPTGWISVNDLLPPNKEGWSHSEQVLVHYDSEPNCFVENYGIAYYHYERPFAEPGFVDFHFPYRRPTHWMAIPALPVSELAVSPKIAH